MNYFLFNTQQYIYQLLYSVYRRKMLVLAVILLSTIIIVASQFNNLPAKNTQDVYNERSQFFLQDSRYEGLQDVNLLRKSLDENIPQDLESNHNELLRANDDKTNDKVQNDPLIDHANNNNKAKKYIPDLRLVHFDLKGAPPKISILKHIIRTSKEAGANGVLLEYEDMFPFDWPISEISAKNHYTKDEIMEIISLCRELDLELIPLVQTFGHMEFALKLSKFRSFREIDRFPTAVCPSKKDPFDKLIKPIIDQVITLHKESGHDLKYIHIGCDEVFHIGSCDLCHGKDRDDLFLKHVNKVASYVKIKHQVQPIIWDDMLRNIYTDKIKQYDLGKLVEPMIWTYIKDIYRFIPYSTFQQFAEIFPAIWGASSFKGAYGETLTVPNADMHLQNNLGWLEALNEQTRNFKKLRGLVLTGWSRYDHLAVLAETLPASIPSLMVNLLTVSSGEFNYKETMSKFDTLMNCSKYSDKMNNRIYGYEKDDSSLLGKDVYLYNRASPCNWAGVTVFRLTQQLSELIKRTNDYIYDVNIHKAWQTDYNFRRNYSNPYRIDDGLNELSTLRYQYIGIMQTANQYLSEFFDKFTTAEWIELNIYPYILKLDRIYNESKRINEVREWENRPLKPLEDLKKFGINLN